MRRTAILALTAALVAGISPAASSSSAPRLPDEGCPPAVCDALTKVAGRLPSSLPDPEAFSSARTLSDAFAAAVPGTPAVTLDAGPGSWRPPPGTALPPGVDRAIALLVAGARQAEAIRAASVPADPGWATRAGRLVQTPYLGRDPRDPIRPDPRVAALAEGLDLEGLKQAAAVLVAAADRAIAELRGVVKADAPCEGAPTPPTEIQEGIVVDTAGVPTLYQEQYTLSIDLGGCDVYDNEAGGADGTDEDPEVGIAIDLGGHDDRYTQPKDTYALGGANNGLGLLVDDGGDDVYRASSWASMGVGIVGAAGVLADLGGDDVYEYVGAGGGFGAQGQGTLGVGALLDLSGDDTYLYEFDPGDTSFGTRLLAAQGAGSVAAHGVLADGGGNDRYTSISYGNTVRIEAQGAADFLPSVGILLDSSGDDVYTIEAHLSKAGGHASGSATGQGEGILDGVGVLLDADGDDRYKIHADATGTLSASAEAAGQGFGTAVITYGASGFLLDLGGDDAYSSTAVATSDNPETEFATQLSQGMGFFIGAGLLADLDGSDTYTQGATARGDVLTAGQGAGLAAATGILADRTGFDRYTAGERSQGYGASHDFLDLHVPGGTGILVDGFSRNVFSGPGSNASFWLQGADGVGVGIDGGRVALSAFEALDAVFFLFGLPRPSVGVSATIVSPEPGTALHGDTIMTGTADAGPLEVEWVDWRADFVPWRVADRGASWAQWSAAVDVDKLADGYHELHARAGTNGIPSGPAVVALQVERWLPTWHLNASPGGHVLAFDLATRKGVPVDSDDVTLRVLSPAGEEVASFSAGLSRGEGRYEALWSAPSPGAYRLLAEVPGQLLGQTTLEVA